MFQKGEYIVYGQHGICLVEDITHLNMSEADEKKLSEVLARQADLAGQKPSAEDLKALAAWEEKGKDLFVPIP